ncbi:hypothetical protein DSL92_03985 [Billgrantia gudaonensis]|uniref:Uncharacterized protein n=1 Tax=Billgrantia gudaonensis TaxID=376427 RepID=A0A3S0QRX3_9GAMM|nr:hypothetical protein DSL92_03985 [Halomonas gudaonensis]
MILPPTVRTCYSRPRANRGTTAKGLWRMAWSTRRCASCSPVDTDERCSKHREALDALAEAPSNARETLEIESAGAQGHISTSPPRHREVR